MFIMIFTYSYVKWVQLYKHLSHILLHHNKPATRKTMNVYSITHFFFFFNGHLSEASVIDSKYIKRRNCKIFTKLVPSQTPSRSSHQRWTGKEDILKNLQNFTGKHLRWSLFYTLFKRDSNRSVFQWNLRNFYKHLFWRISVKDCFCPS